MCDLKVDVAQVAFGIVSMEFSKSLLTSLYLCLSKLYKLVLMVEQGNLA